MQIARVEEDGNVQSDSSATNSHLMTLARLEKEIEELRNENQRWRDLATTMFNNAVLSPENCELYKRVTQRELHSALTEMTDVKYIHCSFPASISNAPSLDLIGRSSCDASDWRISWKPCWSSEVLCVSKKAGIRYSVRLLVTQFEASVNNMYRNLYF